MRAASLLLLAATLPSCAVDGDDASQGGNGKADGNGSCTVPEYGDGTCQIDIACDIPDVDCYTPFDTDDAAAAWLTTQMTYTRVAAGDPRTMRARMLVDRAYELYKSHVQLGVLADKRMSMVLLEGEPNAFIAGDYQTHKGAWSVQVQTGILDGRFTDDQIVGIMQHELTHLSKLHFLDEVADRIRKFYIAPDGKEPIGAQTSENPIAKQYGDAWRKAGKLVGPYTNPELGTFPLSGDLGQIFDWYVTDNLTGPCPTQVQAYQSVRTTLAAAISKLDFSLQSNPSLASQIQSAIDGLRQCGVVDPQTLRGYLDAQSPEWIPYIQPLLAPEEVALLDKPILEAITTIVGAHRTQMRAAQDKFAQESGRPWSAVRFYSFEEAADDGWVRIFQSAKLDGPGSFKGAFMLFLDDQAAACEAALAANAAPYGANYSDEHHGDCWRIAHAAQIGAPSTTARTVDLDETRVPHEPYHRPQRPGANPIY